MISANALTDRRTVMMAPSSSRRRCHCGCRRRATHVGQANGITMMMGCELSARRWMRSPSNYYRAALSALGVK